MADIYDKNILEFATVAVEYCAFVTKAADFSKMEFIDKSQKMLSLLYLKASMLPDASEDDLDGYLEQFVTELEWQSVQDAVSAVIGRHDTYFDATDPQNSLTGETYTACLSECYADIYQDIKNFTSRYRLGEEEIMQLAVADCVVSFRNLWGSRLLSVLSELHLLRYCGEDLSDDEGSSDYNNYENLF